MEQTKSKTDLPIIVLLVSVIAAVLFILALVFEPTKKSYATTDGREQVQAEVKEAVENEEVTYYDKKQDVLCYTTDSGATIEQSMGANGIKVIIEDDLEKPVFVKAVISEEERSRYRYSVYVPSSMVK